MPPNAIATCIATRCINVRAAILTSAVFNFLGVLIMTHINSSVASTISNMVDFGGNTHEALIALCAALFSIVVYSVGAARFGIPTSESHSLIAGLTGAGYRHPERHWRHQHGRVGQGALRPGAEPGAGLPGRVGICRLVILVVRRDRTEGRPTASSRGHRSLLPPP